MTWLSENRVWVLFFAGFIAMHLFGHGGHGKRGGGCGGGKHDAEPARKDDTNQQSSRRSGHQH